MRAGCRARGRGNGRKGDGRPATPDAQHLWAGVGWKNRGAKQVEAFGDVAPVSCCPLPVSHGGAAPGLTGGSG